MIINELEIYASAMIYNMNEFHHHFHTPSYAKCRVNNLRQVSLHRS